MRRPTLIQALSQFSLLSVALAAHDRKGSGVKRLSEYHFDSIPQCVVNCIYRMDRSDLPHCTPDKYYGRFDIEDFIRDKDVADCFCRDLFFVKGFSECIIDTCNRPSQFYRSAQWSYDHCAARGVNLLDPKEIPWVPKNMDLFKNWDPDNWVPPVQWIDIEETSTTATVTSTVNSTTTATATSTTTSISTTTHSLNNTITTTTTINGTPIIVVPTATLTTTISAAPTVTMHPGVRPPARFGDEITIEVGFQSFSGPTCITRCYENPEKAGWFTDAKYKDDVHPECKGIYEKYVNSGMNTNGWSEDDQRKISRCVCTHKSYVKAVSECGLRECSSSNGETQQAILFGYQVCSKKGMIEFPYVDVMIEKLQITVPGNVSLPDRVGLASHGVGGAPTFPILDEDGEKMMFPSGSERLTNLLEKNSLFASYIIGTVFFIAFW